MSQRRYWSSHGSRATCSQLGRAGFTLVEMLVVVAIVVILASILVPAVYLGMSAATDARIAIELSNLDAAMRQYKTVTHGYSFPPNFGTAATVLQHVQQKFGRFDPTATGVTAVPTGLDAAEALVFWLKGYGGNPLDPLAAPRTSLFDFDETRLVDGDGDGHSEYYPKSGQKVPYIYIHHDSYGTESYTNTGTGAGTGTGNAYKTAAGFANSTSYQIISAGQDGHWGANSTDKTFPAGTNYGPEDNDNITNFSEGTLGSQVE